MILIKLNGIKVCAEDRRDPRAEEGSKDHGDHGKEFDIASLLKELKLA
jgi:hypothetical protein